jgi:nucleoside-diphosphate-sugar epimerase
MSSVSVLLLGSGWTSQFLLPVLKSKSISYAYTKRAASSIDANVIPFEVIKEGRQDISSFEALPTAELVVVVFPLSSNTIVDDIISSYEKAKACQPAWLALGSTGAWSKGVISSSHPLVEGNARAASETHLLSLNSKERPTAVLNLAGLYGGVRNPAKFAKKVADSIEKLEHKTSLHLVHGNDVAHAIVGMWEALGDPQQKEKLWGKRWIVTGENEKVRIRRLVVAVTDLIPPLFCARQTRMCTTGGSSSPRFSPRRMKNPTNGLSN